jgi:hypothetical protein
LSSYVGRKRVLLLVLAVKTASSMRHSDRAFFSGIVAGTATKFEMRCVLRRRPDITDHLPDLRCARFSSPREGSPRYDQKAKGNAIPLTGIFQPRNSLDFLARCSGFSRVPRSELCPNTECRSKLPHCVPLAQTVSRSKQIPLLGRQPRCIIEPGDGSAWLEAEFDLRVVASSIYSYGVKAFSGWLGSGQDNCPSSSLIDHSISNAQANRIIVSA